MDFYNINIFNNRNLQYNNSIIIFYIFRNHAVTPAQMILISIRFLASSGMLITVGDFAGIH